MVYLRRSFAKAGLSVGVCACCHRGLRGSAKSEPKCCWAECGDGSRWWADGVLSGSGGLVAVVCRWWETAVLSGPVL